MLANTTCHLMHNVIPAAVDYGAAEGRLSEAYDAHPNNPDTWVDSARAAKRKAAELAIAIDGLTARAVQEINRSKCSIRADVSALCFFPGTTSLRCDALERVRGIANAYKHQNLSDPTLLITSDADVLVVELGYGVEGFGVGKLEAGEKGQKPNRHLSDRISRRPDRSARPGPPTAAPPARPPGPAAPPARTDSAPRGSGRRLALDPPRSPNPCT